MLSANSKKRFSCASSATAILRITHGVSEMADAKDMWMCQVANCGYIYNPDKGDKKGKIAAGTKFEDLPDDWRCPVCGATKKGFKCLGA